MTWDAWIPLLVVASSLLPGLIIFGLAEEKVRLRIALNLFGALAKVLLVGWMFWGVLHGHHYETRLNLLPHLDLVFRAGPLSLLFVALSAGLWLITTVYAIGYLEGSPHRSRFFGFFSLCVTATVGVALAGNLITFLICYELLTLATYPLVVHRGTEEARRAGQVLPCLHDLRWRASIAGHGVAVHLDRHPGVYSARVSSTALAQNIVLPW